MSKIADNLFVVAEPFAANLQLELVDVEYVKEGGQFVLRFLIDKEGGVTLDDCEAFSRIIDEELDRLDPIESSYQLQVSSPGIERPLKKAADYERFSGRLATVKLFAPLNGSKQYTGVLRGLDNQKILLAENKDETVVKIPLELVAKANLVFE